MCCIMCLLAGSPKITVHVIVIGGWLHPNSCWVHTQVTKNCFVVAGYWGQNVDHPTFTRFCKSAVNWLDYGNSFSGIQTTACDRLSASWKDNYWPVLRRTSVGKNHI